MHRGFRTKVFFEVTYPRSLPVILLCIMHTTLTHSLKEQNSAVEDNSLLVSALYRYITSLREIHGTNSGSRSLIFDLERHFPGMLLEGYVFAITGEVRGSGLAAAKLTSDRRGIGWIGV